MKKYGLLLSLFLALSPQARAEEALTLQGCLDLAFANNPEVKAAAWEAEANKEQREGARGASWPKLSIASGFNSYLDNQRLVQARELNEPGTLSKNILSGDLVATLPIYTGGRLSREIEATGFNYQAGLHRLNRQRQELTFQVASAFYGILGQQRVVDSLEFSRRALFEHRKQVLALIEARKAAKVDLLRTDVRLADLAQRLSKEKSTFFIQNRLLANLMGMDASFASFSSFTLQGELQPIPEGPSDLSDSLAKAYRQREDYRASEASIEAQSRRVEGAKALKGPTIFLQGSYGGKGAFWAEKTTASSAEDLGRLGVAIDLPIFEGGQIDAKVKEEQAKLAASKERLRKLRLQLRLDVETAFYARASSTERIQATEKAVEQAQESLRIEREKYDLGRGSVTEVLDAQAALLEAQTSYYRALTDYRIAIAQLRFATGEEK
ncbi:MAG TPA: hypothetical protein DD435_00220 [Cyanobacteria bacterium UBA8530]|nr:hypothetical protein [Cyanobacteria bacterium UBA8530]